MQHVRDGKYLEVTTSAGNRATVLLPRPLPVERKAVVQLAALADVGHPAGGRVTGVYAAPDFHPGDAGVAIGSVAITDGMVIPEAVGSDICCGMRLHAVGADVGRVRAARDQLVTRLRGDYFLGTRDVVFDGVALRALFVDGLAGFGDALRVGGLRGRLARVDPTRFQADLLRCHVFDKLPRGTLDCLPSGLAPTTGTVRDPGLGTIGSGNHFVEVQEVVEVFDAARARAWGLRVGHAAFMIHSGSRHVGKHVGGIWRAKAREAWPRGVRYPESAIFPLSVAATPGLVADYLAAQAAAAYYGTLNRIVLAELLVAALGEALSGVDTPLVYDLPHNLTLAHHTRDMWISRKGACPAEVDVPVVVPGSMGAASFVGVGLGSSRHLCSASHGAGRARSRGEMRRCRDLGLETVDCVTTSDDRRVEEAPAAYKDINVVVGAQVEEGVLSLVAKLRPVLTFKA